MVRKGRVLIRDFRTKILSPKGGVMRPCSTMITERIPNHMRTCSEEGSPTLRVATIGKRTGKVTRRMERLSMKHPKRK